MEKQLQKWIMPIAATMLVLVYWFTTSSQYTHPEKHEIEFKTLETQPDGITCGPTSALMVLKRYGVDNIKLDDVKSKTKTEWFSYGRKPIGMTSPDMLAPAMNHFGVNASMRKGSIKSLKYFVSTDRPVIVLVRSSQTTWHYIVVVAYDKDTFKVADPASGSLKSMKLEDFKTAWEFTSDMSGNSTVQNCNFCKGTGKVGNVNAGPLNICPVCEGQCTVPDVMVKLLEVAEVHPKTMIVPKKSLNPASK